MQCGRAGADRERRAKLAFRRGYEGALGDMDSSSNLVDTDGEVTFLTDPIWSDQPTPIPLVAPVGSSTRNGR